MSTSHNSAYFPGGATVLVAGNGDAVSLGNGLAISNGTLTVNLQASGTSTITLSAPSNATSGAAYTISGTLTGYSSVPTLGASLDSSAFGSLPTGSTVSTSALTLALPASTTVGTHTAQVRDSAGVLSNTLTYIVSAASAGTTTVPGQVTGLSAGTAATTYVPLTWVAPSTGGSPTGYTVNYGISGGTVTSVTTGSTLTNYTLTGLTAATSYVISVAATNSAGTGTASSNASATTAAATTYPTQAVVVPPFAVGSTGASPTSAASPPVVHQVFAFAGTSYNNGQTYTATAASPLTAGSRLTIAILGGSPSQNVSGATFPSGFNKVADEPFCGRWLAVYDGPSSAASGGNVAVSNVKDMQNLICIEHEGGGVDVTAATLASKTTDGTRTYYPSAADKTSAAAYVFISSQVSGAISNVVGATVVQNFPVPYYHAGALLKLDGSGNPVTFNVANGQRDSSTTGTCLSINIYAKPLNKSGASVSTSYSYVLKPGVPVVPTTLSGPSGGLPKWFTDATAAQKQGKQAFISGFFTSSAPNGYDALMECGYWLGRAAGALEFSDYDQTTSYLASNIDFGAGYDEYYGATGALFCFSTATISNDMTYADLAAGYWDAEVAVIGQHLAKNNVNLCRIDWESNDGYYTTTESNDFDQVVAARRRWINIVWQQTGSQVIPFTAPLGAQGGTQVDDNYAQTGDDATLAVGIDLYATAYLDNQGQYTTDTPARQQSVTNAIIHGYTQSADWLTSISRGRPAILGEWGAIGLRGGDGYGIGDVPFLMQQFINYIQNPASNVLAGYWWNNDSGGSDCRIVPRTYYGRSLFPNSAALMQNAFTSTVQGVLSPPALTLSVANGNVQVSAAAGVAGDAPAFVHYQLSRTGGNDWRSMNASALGVTYNTGSLASSIGLYSTALPTKPSDGSAWLVSIRACVRNIAGASYWIETPLNLDTSTVGTALTPYPSTWGLNSDGTYGPKLRAGEMSPTGILGSGMTGTAAAKIQDALAEVDAGNPATVTLPNPLTSGSSVVIRIVGDTAGVNYFTAPKGFTRILDRNLAGRRYEAFFFGPSSALNGSNVITLSGGNAPANSYYFIYARETTGSYIEFFSITGSMGGPTNVMVVPMTASSGGADRAVFTSHDNTAAASGVSVGTIVHTAPGLAGGNYQVPTVVDLPASSSGVLTITTSFTPLNIYASAVNCYTAAPAAGSVVSAAGVAYFNGAPGSATNTTTPPSTSTGTSPTSPTGNLLVTASYNDFTNSAWVLNGGASITPAAGTFADGSSATRLLMTGTAGGIYQNVTAGIVTNSVKMKSNTTSNQIIYYYDRHVSANSGNVAFTVTPTEQVFTWTSDSGISSASLSLFAHGSAVDVLIGEAVMLTSITSTSATSTPVHGATNYAKANMTGGTGNITLTLPNTVTPGSNVLLLWGAKVQPTMPSGWVQLTTSTQSPGYAVSAWVAPASALSGNGLTIPQGYGGCYLIEDSSVSFDAAANAAGTGSNYITATSPALTAGKAVAQRYGFLCGGRNVTDGVGADHNCTVVDTTYGGNNSGDGFTILFTLDPAASTYSFYDYNANIYNASSVGVNGYTS